MNYDKLSPALAAVLDDLDGRGRPGLAAAGRRLGLVSTGPGPKPPRVVVFVHCDEGAQLGHLREAGVELNEGGDTIRTGIVPLEGLDQLSEEPSVRRVVPARRLRPLMDVASEKVGLPSFRTASGLTGAGVVVGVVDTGIEVEHPAFAGRVLRIWDQALPGPGVPEGNYGVELTGELMRVSRDTIGHGTHVAGIAAGVDPTYGGVAPEAQLVIVKSDLLTAHIADGVRYVFRVAAEMGRPAVVNLSLGGHGDAHDGTDSLSSVIDAAVSPGRIVCCAAGNEGNLDIHAQATVRQGRARTISWAMPQLQPGQPPFVAAFNGWYSGEDRMAVGVMSPAGTQTPFQPVLTGESPVRTYELADGAVRITTPGPDPANGDHNFIVEVQPAPASPSATGPGAWRLRLRGERTTEGRVDVWSIDETVAQFTGRSVGDSMKVGSPGAATRAVTMASYTTRVEWTDMFGEPHQSGLDVDDISDFSSEGPRRDEVEKPDVAAPGAMIGSSLSVHSAATRPMLLDALNTIKAGTSMATPFVSGLAALLLQRDPALGPEQVKELLRSRSRIPGRDPGSFDVKWGYGLVHVDQL